MSSISNYYTNNFGPWAVVAGASEGIGASYAKELARKGLNIILIARTKEALDELSNYITNNYKVQVKVIQLDLSTENFLEILISKISDLEIGFLVFNAALSPIGLFHNASMELHNKVIDLNCRAPMQMTHYFGKKMMERGKGGILLMSSLAGLQGNPIHAHYSATRAYNINLAEGLWDEMRSKGIKVMVCLAGPTKTPNYKRSEPNDKGIVSSIAMNPDDVAKEAIRKFRRIRKPIFIAGKMNRFSTFILQHFLSRKSRVKFMGRTAKNMYGEEKNYSNK
ncbi:MAG: SDR family NAD(P)-dependent oxidoreductase [Candidatus Thorarchaeota archaeon]